MLDALEQAFARRSSQRRAPARFLADASHELRTPLASIRGYAELFRMGRDRADRKSLELGDEADRGGGEAHGRAGGGPADCSPAWTKQPRAPAGMR